MAKSIIHEAPKKFQSIKEIALKSATEEKTDGNRFYKLSGLEPHPSKIKKGIKKEEAELLINEYV